MKKNKEQQGQHSVVALDSIIKSIKRRMKKHPEENHTTKVQEFSDAQLKELKRGVRELENFIDLYYGEE